MIGYTLVGTNDIDRATEFYDTLFESIGVARALTVTGKRYWGLKWGGAEPLFGISTPFDSEAATIGNGSMVALRLGSREQVADTHALALRMGGTDEGAPGLRGPEGSSAFYGAYFRDRDQNKIGLYHLGGPSAA